MFAFNKYVMISITAKFRIWGISYPDSNRDNFWGLFWSPETKCILNGSGDNVLEI